jgi:UDP-glucose 4-epimerase
VRVAIVGASGNIGTSLVSSLTTTPGVDEIVGIARRIPTWQPPKTRWAAADIARDDLTEAFRGSHAVVHLAWLIQPSRDRHAIHRVNVVGSKRVFEAAAAAGVRAIVYASSVGAYSPGPKDVARGRVLAD